MKKSSVRIFAAALGLFVIASAISIVKFEVYNPLSTVNGLVQIMFTDTQYMQVQDNPKVIFAKPHSSLLPEYMANRGFIELDNERFGAIHTFENNSEKEQIVYSQNRYFSRWVW